MDKNGKTTLSAPSQLDHNGAHLFGPLYPFATKKRIFFFGSIKGLLNYNFTGKNWHFCEPSWSDRNETSLKPPELKGPQILSNSSMLVH